MTPLSPRDFSAYFEAVHGSPPFPWQTRLLERVAREGRFPALLDLPTGSGKTAVLDVAVFHLALDPARAPRRIVLVVDRRTVVDQAFERAELIAARLRAPTSAVLDAVAARLRAIGDSDEPLATVELRGGMPRDDGWARRPDQPLVAASTVDQVGSRLLFRGYGVSEAMRPIHAGLLGNDTLLLLDEVHLSQPFRETLSAITDLRGERAAALPDRFQVVEMSATPGGDASSAFRLDAADRGDERLKKRLGAKKPAEAREIKVSGGEDARRSTFAAACAEWALGFAGPGRAVGVVVNRVATAREVFARVRARLPEPARVFLMTGRMRPLDRDDLDRALRPLVRSDRARSPAADPVVVVSTQCIEAGADFDFDALVTECAALDALRQRFGRLDRLGLAAEARAVVLARSDALGKESDPIYGDALRKTFRWLGEGRDLGIDAMEKVLPTGEALAELLAPKGRAPVLLPAHLDLWSQTRPAPRPDPDVALWLHGIDRKQEAEVQVVWRADVSEGLLTAAGSDVGAMAALVARLEACAPVGLEALTLPIGVVRAWLREEGAADVADVSEAPREEEARPRPGRPALLWRGEDSAVIDAGALRPGTTLVVPSGFGGLTDGAWDPTSRAPVPDLGDRARWQQTGRATLRLCRSVADPRCTGFPAPASDEEGDDRAAVGAWLAGLTLDGAPDDWLSAVIAALGRSKRPAVLVRHEPVRLADGSDQEGYLTLIGRGRARDASTEDDGGSHTGVEVTLDAHLQGVARWARELGERCGMPPAITHDLELAGRWHDAGKVDPRFQRLLHGGSAYRAEVAEAPLAKSAIVAGDRAAREQARERAGYPRGARHELSSVALLAAHPPLLEGANDRDLVLHLVASHHGFCRPFAPVVDDPAPVTLALDTRAGVARAGSDHGLARLDSGVADRFFTLVERYGWFGLAWLESIVRLADHRRSEEEQRPTEAS